MTEIEFGVLEDVDARIAWSYEPRNFTPWLASNLGRLEPAIGMKLELIKTENAVGRYFADIFAQKIDGSTVLIENQLEVSDHRHLGQILTYLTGLQAKTVIWIAPSFRDEHLSAIKWLNENTSDPNTKEPFAFFAVKVRVVRIGASPLAPLFEVLESPNNWDRQLEQTAEAAREVGPQVLRRRTFWKKYAEKFPDVAGDVGAGGGASIWHAVPATELVVSQWLSRDSVGLFVRGLRGVSIPAAVDQLKPFKQELEVALGASLEHPQFPLYSSRPGDVESDADFEAQANWLHERLLLYKTELTKVLGTET